MGAAARAARVTIDLRFIGFNLPDLIGCYSLAPAGKDDPMKALCSWLLIGLMLTTPALAATSPHDEAARLKPGTRIEVSSINGEKLKGRLGEVSTETVTLL